MQRLAMAIGLLGTLVLVTAIRFNQRDLGFIGDFTGTGVDGNLGDASAYIRYVEAIRGDVESLPPAPFRYRPLTPLLAAPLPFDAMTSINIVNVVALALAAFSLAVALRALGCSDRMAALGSALFIASFPTFYYGTIGYVDPLAIALMALTFAALAVGRYGWVTVALIAAALARESTVVMLVAAVVWLWAEGRPRSTTLRWALTWSCAFVAVVAIVRLGLAGDGINVWEPSLQLFADNATRPRTWISAALTLGLPCVIIAVAGGRLRRLGTRRLVFFAVGGALCLGLFAYSLVAAYADGRFLWPIYVFSVPLAVLLVAQPVQRPEVDAAALDDATSSS